MGIKLFIRASLAHPGITASFLTGYPLKQMPAQIKLIFLFIYLLIFLILHRNNEINIHATSNFQIGKFLAGHCFLLRSTKENAFLILCWVPVSHKAEKL